MDSTGKSALGHAVLPDAWVEVNGAALRHNLQQVRQWLPSNVGLLAVVKGNGFGHGYIEPARIFVDAGGRYAWYHPA